MPTRPVPFAEIRRTVETWCASLEDGWPADGSPGKRGAITETTSRLGLPISNRNSVRERLDTAVALGLEVPSWRVGGTATWASDQHRRYHDDEDYLAFSGAGRSHEVAPTRSRPVRGTLRRDGRGAARPDTASAPAVGSAPPGLLNAEHDHVNDRRYGDVSRGARSLPEGTSPADPAVLDAEQAALQIIPLLRRGPTTVVGIAEKLNVGVSVAFHAVAIARARGASIHERNGQYHLDAAPAMGSQVGGQPSLVSDENGVIRFGAVGDTHLGSKYARLDCLEDFYDTLQHHGITKVLHAGNWIDGEAPFNRHDLLVHGMDQQMQYLAKTYPQRDGIETWAITGEDHEGWYSRREGIDVGRYAERVMHDNGRTDWRDLGFMECFVPLVHGGTGASSKLCLMHPGGGSAYAVSYAPQKIVEGFDGGDKPSVLLIGHYHKASYNMIRNVHTVQVGCFEDQTVFMRKQKLSAHLGGFRCELRLDPETGAVEEFTSTFRNYFVRDYYNNRWSQHGPVNHAPRRAGA